MGRVCYFDALNISGHARAKVNGGRPSFRFALAQAGEMLYGLFYRNERLKT
jgi:hypothetical protein